MKRKKEILITHPGRQHSHQLAMALHSGGLLAEYWTGVPAKPLAKLSALPFVTNKLEKHAFLQMPEEKIRHFFIEPIIRRLATPLTHGMQVAWSYKAMEWFDRRCARKLDEINAGIVVGYENAAFYTFTRAKELGMVTILDAASLHHNWQDRFYDYPESDRIHRRITENKDREIELADHITTVSDFARQSYIDAGIEKEKVVSIPVGCDLDQFKFKAHKDGRRKFRFIFAGDISLRKGIDILNKACLLLEKKDLPFQVKVVGNWNGKPDFSLSSRIQKVGWMSHEALAKEYAASDCLVLPSRHDSFGMVVVEAMASGTPVIISDRTGAKEAVTEGESGWVISIDDERELAKHMEWCINHPEQVRNMRKKAREDAEQYSWERYREKVPRFYTSLLKSQKVPQS